MCGCMRGRRKGVGCTRGRRGGWIHSTTVPRTQPCVWRCVWARGVARSRTRATLISSCNVRAGIAASSRGWFSNRRATRGPASPGISSFVSSFVWVCASVCDSVVCAIVNCFARWREYQFYRAPSIEEVAARIFLRLIREVESYLWVCMHWEYTPAHPGYGIFFFSLDYLNI